MSPFTPADSQARWRTLYELLRKVDVGKIFTYEEMAAALQVDPKTDRPILQLAMRRASRELERVDKHAVDAVPNVGYLVVEAEVHLLLARRHQRKAGRSLERGHSKAINVDFNEIDDETRKAFEVVASAFAAQRDFNRRLDIRQKNLETAVEAVQAHHERTDEELAELRARLARLEQRRTSGSA